MLEILFSSGNVVAYVNVSPSSILSFPKSMMKF